MENNTQNLNNTDLLANESIFNLEAKKIYENCELIGIKILHNEEYLAEKFGKSIADDLVGEAMQDENGYSSIDNEPELAELFYIS